MPIRKAKSNFRVAENGQNGQNFTTVDCSHICCHNLFLKRYYTFKENPHIRMIFPKIML